LIEGAIVYIEIERQEAAGRPNPVAAGQVARHAQTGQIKVASGLLHSAQAGDESNKMTKLESKLSNLIELSSSVRVYVPSTVDTDTAADTSEVLARVQELLSSSFGGATTFDAVGCWVSPSAGLVRESVKVVQSHCDESALRANIDAVIELAESIKVELAQEAVALEINNKLYLV
jgi:hypothetical protein